MATSFLKGLDMLTVLARRPEGLPVALIVRKLQLPRTSVLRMLTTLEHYGLVAKKGRQWCATEQFYQWSSRETHEEIKRRYSPLIAAVAAEVGELVELALGEAGGVRYIHWEKPQQAATTRPLNRAVYPLHKTAAGKLLLSQQPALRQTITDRRLLAEIDEAYATGLAWNRRESNPDLAGIATWLAAPSATAPIICVIWPASTFTEAKAQWAMTVIRRELDKLRR